MRETGLTVSAGVAPSKFVAKIASDMEKPDGLTMVLHDKVREFLDPLPVSKMWGAGKVTQKALEELSIRTFRDLRQMPIEVLERKLGKNGTRMHILAMGIDDRDVVPEHDVKSIGHEETFAEDILDLNFARKELLSLSNKVARRMRREGLEGKTVSLKVKYSDFKQITRSITLQEYTDDGHEIYSNVCSLLTKTATGKRPVRLLGVSISHLSIGPEDQLSLFPIEDKTKTKKELHTAMDSICDKFGDKGIRPASLITK